MFSSYFTHISPSLKLRMVTGLRDNDAEAAIFPAKSRLERPETSLSSDIALYGCVCCIPQC
jgi:hypothetical protein